MSDTNYRQMAYDAAIRYGLDPRIFLAQIDQESGFNPGAYNENSGATGIAQIVPSDHPGVDATDAEASLNYAARLMSGYVKQYGNYATALAAYDAGPGNVQQYGGVPPFQETQQYINKIMGSAGGSNMGDPIDDYINSLPDDPTGDGTTPVGGVDEYGMPYGQPDQPYTGPQAGELDMSSQSQPAPDQGSDTTLQNILRANGRVTGITQLPLSQAQQYASLMGLGGNEPILLYTFANGKQAKVGASTSQVYGGSALQTLSASSSRPILRTVGKMLYQYNPTTDTWRPANLQGTVSGQLPPRYPDDIEYGRLRNEQIRQQMQGQYEQALRAEEAALNHIKQRLASGEIDQSEASNLMNLTRQNLQATLQGTSPWAMQQEQQRRREAQQGLAGGYLESQTKTGASLADALLGTLGNIYGKTLSSTHPPSIDPLALAKGYMQDIGGGQGLTDMARAIMSGAFKPQQGGL